MGKGLYTRTEASWLRRAVPPECKGVGLGVSTVSCQNWPCAASSNCSWGGWEGNGTRHMNCSWRGIRVNTSFWGHAPRRANKLYLVCPSVLQIPVSKLSELGCLPAFFPEATQPSLLMFKTPGFKPSWLQDSWYLAPLLFQVNGCGIMFCWCVPPCAPLPLSFSPSPHPWLPSPLQHPTCFSPLNHDSTLPTFFNVASSLHLFVEFVL